MAASCWYRWVHLPGVTAWSAPVSAASVIWVRFSGFPDFAAAVAIESHSTIQVAAWCCHQPGRAIAVWAGPGRQSPASAVIVSAPIGKSVTYWLASSRQVRSRSAAVGLASSWLSSVSRSRTLNAATPAARARWRSTLWSHPTEPAKVGHQRARA